MRKADNLPLSRAFVTKSGSLNFLEPSGPVQACNGTAESYDILTLCCVAPAVTSVCRGPNIVQHRLVSDPSGYASPLDSDTKGIHT